MYKQLKYHYAQDQHDILILEYQQLLGLVCMVQVSFAEQPIQDISITHDGWVPIVFCWRVHQYIRVVSNVIPRIISDYVDKLIMVGLMLSPIGSGLHDIIIRCHYIH